MGGTITKVLSGLYVGGFGNVRNREDLIANCITHVLFVQSSSNEVEKFPSEVEYLNIHVSESDECGLRKNVMKCNDFIHTARVSAGNVLVCSESGVSTNITFVAAYLMSIYVLNAHDAVGVLQGLVQASKPSSRMRAQLLLFGKPKAEIIAAADSSLTSTCADEEHFRLMDKFGPWVFFDDDFNQLSKALTDRKESAQSDLLFPNSPELSPPVDTASKCIRFQHHAFSHKETEIAVQSSLGGGMSSNVYHPHQLIPTSTFPDDPLQTPVGLPSTDSGFLFGMDPNDPLAVLSDFPLNPANDDLLQEDLPDVMGRRVDRSHDNETGSEDSVPGSVPIQHFVSEFSHDQRTQAMSYQAGRVRQDPYRFRTVHGDDLPGVSEQFHEDVSLHRQLSTTAPVRRQFYDLP